MASPSEKSSSSSRSTMSLMPGRIVIACDATRNRTTHELKEIIAKIQARSAMIQEVDTITVIGALHKVLHPMGFPMQIGADSFIGVRSRAIKEEVLKLVDSYACALRRCAEECEAGGVIIEVKIVVGAPLKKVVVHEAVASNATWLVLNRHLRKDLRFYLKHVPCKMALVLENFSLEILRPYYSDKATPSIEQKLFYTLTKLVTAECPNVDTEQSFISPNCRQSPSPEESSDAENSCITSMLTPTSTEQSIFSPDQPRVLETSGIYSEANDNHGNSQQSTPNESSAPVVIKLSCPKMDSDTPHESEEINVGTDCMSCCYSELAAATNEFSTDNLLGEGGYGSVYKGRLSNGQLIVAKVQKEVNMQGRADFHSELRVLTMACHKNIVMLHGYCLKNNLDILVYEYVCNKTLEWHLFDNELVFEWHRRHNIAVGIAKGLRFLHEECRGSPIIHRDLRLSNVLLTHDFVPLLGDCGLAKWKVNKLDRASNALEYLSPEYAEKGICSVNTDVFAFGIVLIQLISGRKAMNTSGDGNCNSLRQWAMPLIQTLELDELVDPRLGDVYSTYEVYQMARLAYKCVQSKPAMRPTIAEVLHVLEGKNDHLSQLMDQFKLQRGDSPKSTLLQ